MKYASNYNRKVKWRKSGPVESIKDKMNNHRVLVGTSEVKNHLEELGIDGRVRQDISFICGVAVSPRTRVANLWHAALLFPICFIPFDLPVSLYCEKYVCIYIYMYIYTQTYTRTRTHTHIWLRGDCM
jgi:hypothetical protein